MQFIQSCHIQFTTVSHFAALVILLVLVIASAMRVQICKLKMQETPGFLPPVLKEAISDEDIIPQSMYIQHFKFKCLFTLAEIFCSLVFQEKNDGRCSLSSSSCTQTNTILYSWQTCDTECRDKMKRQGATHIDTHTYCITRLSFQK